MLKYETDIYQGTKLVDKKNLIQIHKSPCYQAMTKLIPVLGLMTMTLERRLDRKLL